MATFAEILKLDSMSQVSDLKKSEAEARQSNGEKNDSPRYRVEHSISTGLSRFDGLNVHLIVVVIIQIYFQ